MSTRITNRDELITSHLFLVRAIARRVKCCLPSHVDHDDLASAGHVGLVQATDKFDPRRGASFSAFASYRIRGAIYDMLRREDWAPRVFRRGARISGECLPKMIPFSVVGLRDINHRYHTDSITRDHDADLTSNLLSYLDDRSRRVVSMRYLDRLSVKVIAAVLRISTSRVSEINKRALRQMRRSA